VESGSTLYRYLHEVFEPCETALTLRFRDRYQPTHRYCTASAFNRIQAGVAAARAKGKFGGAPRKLGESARRKVRKQVTSGLSHKDVGKLHGVSRMTISRIMRDTPVDER
jgi:hypothetical protein